MAVIDGDPHWNLPRASWGEGGDTAAEALGSEAQELGPYLVRGVLAIGLPCSCSSCQSPGPDVAEIDLSLGRRASTGLAPDNDGAARKDLARKEDRQALGGAAKTRPTAQQAPFPQEAPREICPTSRGQAAEGGGKAALLRSCL